MEITGEISNIIYKNEINSYTIAEYTFQKVRFIQIEGVRE